MRSRLNIPTEAELNKALRLENNRLPSFPHAAAKLIQASQDDTASLKDFAKILETDPGLSIQVLKIVNSPVYGLNRKITTLSEAVVFLGMDELRKQALSMTLFRQMFENNRSESFDLLFFWRHLLSVAVLSHEIAKAVRYPDPEEAYVAGLLHDVGKIFLILQGRVDYAAFIQALSIDTDVVIEEERRFIGMGHDAVGAWFCDQWKLPEKLTAVARYHHQAFERQDLSDSEKKLISLVSLADFLCWTQGIGSFDFIHPPVLAPEVGEMIELGQAEIIEAIGVMNREMENISAYYDFVFPSAGQLQKNLLLANLALSKANTRYFFQMDLLPRGKTPDEESSRNREMELEFGKPLARARSVKEVFDIVMYQIGRIFEPLQWSILLKNPKSGDLVFSVVVGEHRRKLQGVKLAQGEGIAGHIMETGQPLVVEDVSKDSRFSDRTDKYTGFQTRSVIGAPLKTGDKIFGVIELINRIGETPFTKKDLVLFSTIAEYAAIAIEQSYYTQALTRLATKDVITDLKNRWSFERLLEKRNDFKIRYGAEFSMLIIRVGGLGRLLQTHGQQVCDNAVKTFARLIDTTKRRNDSLFRYSENIFLLLLPRTCAKEAEITKHRIEKAIQADERKNSLLFSDIHMMSHTLSSEEIEKLIPLVGKSMPASGKTEDFVSIPDISENLQPLLAAETPEAPVQDGLSKKFGKAVSLRGHCQYLKSKKNILIKVERISMVSIGFRVVAPVKISPRDYLNIQFILDDQKRSVINRQALVLEVDGNYIYADFHNPPPYDKDLGFYVLS
jgi:two-component system, cell cycle response regulator